MLAPLQGLLGQDSRILVGLNTGDDAGVFLVDGIALVATVDFITPVCDDPLRFGRIAAANSLSDVYAMGGRPLFALNICCFPKSGVPEGVLAQVIHGAALAVQEAGAAVLGGHSVHDNDLKFGLCVVGKVDPARILTNAGAQPGDRLLLTKPLGTGVLINAYRKGKLDAAGLEPALLQMERLNDRASALGLQHGVHSATDVTGFGLTGHALGMAKASNVALRIQFDRLIAYEAFYELVAQGVTTGSTRPNTQHAQSFLTLHRELSAGQLALLHDPQTSGALLLSTPPQNAQALLEDLLNTGHAASEIGEVLEAPAGLHIV